MKETILKKITYLESLKTKNKHVRIRLEILRAMLEMDDVEQDMNIIFDELSWITSQYVQEKSNRAKKLIRDKEDK